VAVHDPRDGDALERRGDYRLTMARLGGVVQEPADQRQPKALHEAGPEEGHALPEHHEGAEADEDPGDALPGKRGPARRLAVAPGRPPERRAQHAPAVEREARDQ